MNPSSAPPTRRRRTVVWTLVFGYAGVALVVVRNFALVPVYLWYLSLGEYGAWLATAGVLSQVLLNDFGLTAAVTQRAAAAFGRNDRTTLSHVVGTSLTIAALLGVLVSLVTAALGPLAPGLVGLRGEPAERLSECFLVLALGVGPGIVAYAATGILKSLERPIHAGAAGLIAEICGVLLTVVMLLGGFGLYALAAGHALRGVLACALSLLGCLHAVACLSLRVRWSRAHGAAMLAASSRQLLTAFAMRIQARADPFFIALLLSPEAAAAYSLTIRAHETVVMLLGQVGASLGPALANAVGRGDERVFAQALRAQSLTVGLAGAIGLCGVAAFNRDFLTLWVGGGIFSGDAVTWLVAAATLIGLLGTAPYDGMMAQGRFGALARVFLSGLVLHLALLVTLVQWGAWGAALAGLISAAVRSFSLHGAFRGSLPGAARAEGRPLASLLGAASPALALAVLITWLDLEVDTWPAFVLAVGGYVAAALAASWKLAPGSFGLLIEQARRSRRALAPGR